jgi:hypothetical protein
MRTLSRLRRGMLLPILSIALISTSLAQGNRMITAGEQKAIIDTAFKLLNTNYIFPDRITTMYQAISAKLTAGTYAKHTSLQPFLKELNNDLETLSNDRHVDIFYDPVRVKQITAESGVDTTNVKAYAPEFLERAKYENYMLRKAERLDGNLGYLKFNAFVDTSLSKSTMVAAMNFVANTSALIIDLRQNGGGDANACNFLLGYFLPDSTLVSVKRLRNSKELQRVYIRSNDAVKKLTMPVYILVSRRTSSAAEAFAYTLQAFKRATVIGDTTNGEANPGYLFALNKEMYIMIPAFENINAVTKTNWQAIGIAPDNPISADKALILAQAKAYGSLQATTEVKELKSLYGWMAEGYKGELSPVTYTMQQLQSFAGGYTDNRVISSENGVLYYERTGAGSGKKRLIPLTQNLFSVDGIPYFRIRFAADENGIVTSLEGLYDDGQNERSTRIK